MKHCVTVMFSLSPDETLKDPYEKVLRALIRSVSSWQVSSHPIKTFLFVCKLLLLLEEFWEKSGKSFRLSQTSYFQFVFLQNCIFLKTKYLLALRRIKVF